MTHNPSDNDANRAEKLVSVIIAVYNGERFLAEAIESVLAQDYRPIEIIVVDDGSTDESAAIAKRYPEVVYTYQPNQGVGAALNLGITTASGDYLAFLDADDVWMENKLSLQMAILDEHPELDIVFGHHQRFYEAELVGMAEDDRFPENKKFPGYFKGTALIRKASFWRVGLFNTSLKLGDFIEWYSRALYMGLKMMMQSEVILRRRVHLNNSSYHKQDNRADYVRIMKAALDRRRQKNTGESTSLSGSGSAQDQA